MERTFSKKIESLGEIFSFAEEFAAKSKLGDDLVFKINFSIEEVFTNMVKYSPEGSEDVAVSLDVEKGRLKIELTDFKVDKFDITKIPEPDIDRANREGDKGGRGLFLVKNLVDDLGYCYENGNSKITMTINLEK